eukprot:1373949-Amphidinium_carterae.1
MSLEDHSITYIMDEVKLQQIPTVDTDCIEHEPEKQHLSVAEANRRKDIEQQRLLQVYNDANRDII